MKKIILILLLIDFLKLNAQDRVFTYTYQSNVLSAGQHDLEVWTTLSNGKDNYYLGLDHRIEFEVGLGGKLQTSVYLNYGYSKGIVNDNGIEVLSDQTEFSFSNEWKLKLSDPVASRVGSALYFEYLISPDETELEGKIILDKQFGNIVNALNIVSEYDIERNFVQNGNIVNKENTNELNLELDYGLSYHISDKFSGGFELTDENHIEKSIYEYSVLSGGPCFTFVGSGFLINLTCLPQITNLKGGSLELEDHSKLQTRLILSYAF